MSCWIQRYVISIIIIYTLIGEIKYYYTLLIVIHYLIFLILLGRFCECEEGAPTHGRECISPNGEECSNQGKCECGKCACNEGYTGKCCQIKIADVEEDDCGGRSEMACSGKIKMYLTNTKISQTTFIIINAIHLFLHAYSHVYFI